MSELNRIKGENAEEARGILNYTIENIRKLRTSVFQRIWAFIWKLMNLVFTGISLILHTFLQIKKGYQEIKYLETLKNNTKARLVLYKELFNEIRSKNYIKKRNSKEKKIVNTYTTKFLNLNGMPGLRQKKKTTVEKISEIFIDNNNSNTTNNF